MSNVDREFAGERRVVVEAIESRNHMRENRETSLYLGPNMPEIGPGSEKRNPDAYASEGSDERHSTGEAAKQRRWRRR